MIFGKSRWFGRGARRWTPRLVRLEDRLTPTMTMTLVGTVVTITGDAGADNPLFYIGTQGSPIQQPYFSPHFIGNGQEGVFDCDNTKAGVQDIRMADLTALVLDLGGGLDSVVFFNSINIPTTTFKNIERVGVLFNSNDSALLEEFDATLTDGGISFFGAPTNYDWTFETSPEFVRMENTGAKSGSNTFDGSAVTKYHMQLAGFDGNDILRGGAMPDLIDGGNGDDVVEGGGGDDNRQFYSTLGTLAGLFGGAGNDTMRGGDGDDYLEDIGPHGAADGGPGTDFFRGIGYANVTVTDASFAMGSTPSVGNGFEAIRIDGTTGDDVFDASKYTLGQVGFSGGDGNDTLLGGAKIDLLYGGNGDDLIDAGGGDDGLSFSTLFGYQTGVFGGAGNDILRGGDGRDYLDGGDGDDILEGGLGNDSGQLGAMAFGLYGRTGNDILRGGDGDDYLEDIGPSGAADGGAGTDFYYASMVSGAVITAGSFSMGGTPSVGNTMELFYLDGDGNANVMDATGYNLGSVVLRGFGGNDTLIGGELPDRIDGGEGDDNLDGRGGSENDANIPLANLPARVIGGNGNDVLRGGDGDDYLEDIGGTGGAADGGPGIDRFYGSGFGTATITDAMFTYGSGIAPIGSNLEGIWLDGTAGPDSFDGSAATLTGFVFRGFGGNDILLGGGKTDGIEGGDGDDTISGNGGDDRAGIFALPWIFSGGLVGGNDNDTISGGGGKDGLNGGEGNDTITGDGGNDSIFAGNGDDTIIEGPEANDLLTGEGGFDSLFITATPNADLIIVANPNFTINGALTTYQLIEALTIDAGAGLDEGTEVGGPNPIAYVVNNLEPTVNAGADEYSNASPFVRTGSFKDIGAGQSWTAVADYGDGSGVQPIPINQANRTYDLSHTYVAPGNYTIQVTVTDNAGNSGTDSFIFTKSPQVTGLVVNGGAVQRSRLTTIDLTFSSALDMTAFQTAGAVTLTRTAGGPSTVVDTGNGLIVAPATGMSNTMSLTFQNLANTGVEFGSLADGRWQLAIPSLSFTSPFNGSQVFRLYGDADGNGTVNSTDFLAFRLAFLGNSAVFDFDNSGQVDTADFLAFRLNFLKII